MRNFIKEVVGEDYLAENPFINFSGLKGQTKVGREGLNYFSKRVTLIFSSGGGEFINFFLNKLFDFQHLLLGDLVLEPEYVEREYFTGKFGNSVKFLCLSPIVICNTDNVDKNKEFIHPTKDDFSDFLYESTMLRMERIGQFTPKQISSFFKFQMVPDKHYLEKINNHDKKFARIYTTINQGMIKEVRGYTLPFALYAAPEVQNFIYNCGLGELAENGFGMLDLADNKEVKREIIFEKSLKKMRINIQ
ncbi:CRISPR-associated endoribonuclease Cas6 [Flexithrix dorotheae]|uniref:CRISPR-associated endoribonuclease Cas6 n=1 Tax=Flexithrix dorotheae TaxID=70993 RepID=UPI0012F8ABA2|nr:CRISPR-associated endoribonuclease Cas6 [Flexithrix dorotheae]